jgi:hypothetical protein
MIEVHQIEASLVVESLTRLGSGGRVYDVVRAVFTREHVVPEPGVIEEENSHFAAPPRRDSLDRNVRTDSAPAQQDSRPEHG